MKTYPIVYTAVDDGGVVQGVAQVPVPDGRSRPSWADCAAFIPGFFTDKSLAPQEEADK
jgi:hypothetical protein